MNKQYLKKTDLDSIVEYSMGYLDKSKISHLDKNKITMLIEFGRDRISKLTELEAIIAPFLNELNINDEDLKVLNSKNAQKLLSKISSGFSQIEDWSGKECKSLIMGCGKDLSIKGKDLFFPVRMALYGESQGPDLPIILDILGKDESINRINKVVQ